VLKARLKSWPSPPRPAPAREEGPELSRELPSLELRLEDFLDVRTESWISNWSEFSDPLPADRWKTVITATLSNFIFVEYDYAKRTAVIIL
jgi:hypothetical protein